MIHYHRQNNKGH